MSDNKTQPGVRVNESIWSEFRQDVRERKGAVKGYLGQELENAIQEYIDASHGGDTHDRLTQIEQDIAEIRATLSEREEKNKDSGLGSVTEQRLANIKDTIADEVSGDVKVHESVVELAIRQHAGGSSPTLERYKELLMEDRELFPHPANKSLFFRSASDFVLATNQLRKGGKITQDEYDELTQAYGEDWWRDRVERATDGGHDERGIQ